MIWREILLQLFGLSVNEGDEHKWVIPSAVSADSHKELTVRQIIQHFGFFTSDAILEDNLEDDLAAKKQVDDQEEDRDDTDTYMETIFGRR